MGVNLGNLYLPARAVDESPVFSQTAASKAFADIANGPLHLALVLIKAPELLHDTTLQGIGLTLLQLCRLGLSCVVMVDHPPRENFKSLREVHPVWRASLNKQVERIAAAIDHHGGRGARPLDSIFEFRGPPDSHESLKLDSSVRIISRNSLLAPLRRGIIPVIVPIGYHFDTQIASAVSPLNATLALTRELAGLSPCISVEDNPLDVAEKITTLQKQVSLDRIIILDPGGGIPSMNRPGGSHIFINLEQEYKHIQHELREAYSHGNFKETKSKVHLAEPKKGKSVAEPNNQLLRLGKNVTLAMLRGTPPGTMLSRSPAAGGSITTTTHGDPSTKFTGIETKSGSHNNEQDLSPLPETWSSNYRYSPAENLLLAKQALDLLPPSSSVLLTTPFEAANSTRSTAPAAPGVGTRSQRNPLIHNLLTDKPVYSSSLPTTRVVSSNTKISPGGDLQSSTTTFIKQGMPVTLIPDPFTQPWTPPTPTTPLLKLSDPRIDLPRLIHLIEDSFGRKLDIEHYLSRISNKLAGIIIAGSYEGGALLTWESPPGSHDSPSRLVPYLDKFAVLKRSQGAGGVADIVFSAMVRDCFPHGVVWRSRRDNPVNKWYFERARGTRQLPVKEPGGQGWTMFWTTEGVSGERFADYEAVCEAVVPSWGDGKAVLD